MKATVIARSNLTRFLRERSNVFFVFVLPIAIVILVGAQFGSGSGLRLGVVSSGDPLSEAVVDDLEGVVHFDGRDPLVLAVERGAVDAGVIFPEDFESQVVDGMEPTVVFLARTGGIGPQLRSVVDSAVARRSVEALAIRFATQRGASVDAAREAVSAVSVESIDVESVDTGDRLFPESLGRFDIGASGQLVLFMFLTGLTGSAALIQTRRLGVSRRMLSTPTRVSTIVVGEAIGRWLVVLVQGAYIMGLTALIFGVEWGDPLGAVGMLVVFSAVGAAGAMLVGSFFENDQQAGAIGVIGGIGLAALGGAMVPRQLFSDTMQTVSLFTPHGWAMRGFSDLVIYDATFVDVLDEMAVLSVMAVVGLTVASIRLRRVLTR